MLRRFLGPWRRRRRNAAEASKTLLLMMIAVKAAAVGEPVVFINAAVGACPDQIEATVR